MSEVSPASTTVLLTGAGGAVVPILIESLRKKGYRVLAADMDSNAIGLYIADQGYLIPGGLSQDFYPILKEICLKEKVSAVVPLVDEELIASLELEKEGVVVLLPKREFVAICLDKLILMQRLKAVDINVPKTCLVTDDYSEMHFPLIVKPRTGRGSRGVRIAESEQDLLSFIKASPYASQELLLQEYINGPEYTISVVVWRDGEVQAVIPKEIISKKGITHIAVTRRNFKIESMCCKVQEQLKADGPFNVQLRIDSVTNEPYIFEINPRFSTSISLTMAAGIDELGGLLFQAFNGKESYKFEKWKEGIVLLRQTLDSFIEEKDFLVRDRNIKKYQR